MQRHYISALLTRFALGCGIGFPYIYIEHFAFSKTETSEVISKTSSDHWVIANKLDDRHECYIVSDQKNANLIDVYGKNNANQSRFICDF